MQEMVKQEVAKAMHLHSIKPEEPNRNSNSVMAVQQESLETITPEVAKSVRDGMDQSLLSIKNKKFPSALPVLTMISSENVQNVPAWETAHRNQLDLESGNHQLYIVNGGHYIWYTNLTQVVQLINEWRMENHF